MTKLIILVKIRMLYVIQGVKNIFNKVTSWPQLISEFAMLLLIGPTLFMPKVFLFSIDIPCSSTLDFLNQFC